MASSVSAAWNVRDMNEDLETIYRAHAPAVFTYAVRVIGNRELAEDFTSDAFLELHRHWDSIDVERLPGWLFTVVRNRAVDYWRKRANERRYMESLQEPACSEPALQLENWLVREPALKPIHRLCLILHFVHGMTRGEIAQRLAVSETKVKGHLQYALQLLRKAWACTA